MENTFKNMLENSTYKIISSILLLLGILSLPYGYYQLLRILITLSAGISTFEFYNKNNQPMMYLFLLIAILFNPLLPLHFNKSIWIIIDLITALIFLISIKLVNNKNKTS